MVGGVDGVVQQEFPRAVLPTRFLRLQARRPCASARLRERDGPLRAGAQPSTVSATMCTRCRGTRPFKSQNAVVALLLCDLDDTLADRQTLFNAWIRSFLAEVGGGVDDASWLIELDASGLTPRGDFFTRVIERFSLDESVDAFYERYHRDYVLSFRCTSDVVSALERARRAGFKIAIVTNGATRDQTSKVKAAGLGNLVDTCCISEAEGVSKPAPEIFLIAAERCGESLDGAWMIGDNPVADIGGASALGISTVWLRLGRTWPEDLEHLPTRQADSLLEAIESILACA
jgi:putative hydrolase of the HAD superfamily